MGRPRTKFESLVTRFERHDTTVGEALETLDEDEIDEVLGKIRELEEELISGK